MFFLKGLFSNSQRFRKCCDYLNISINIVEEMIGKQFPQWNQLAIRAVEKSGHDNRIFHLGDDMAIRMTSGKNYEPQVKKEAKCLPNLAPHISLPITEPIAVGKPTEAYPYVWVD